MRTAAEVKKIAAAVHRDDAVFRNVGETFQLVFLIRKQFFRFFACDFDPFKRVIRLDDLRHLLLDLREFLDIDMFRNIEIVIEAVIRTGADIEFRIGIKLFHGCRHHMGGAVPEGFNGKLHFLSFLENKILQSSL